MKIGRSLEVMNSKDVKNLLSMLNSQFGLSKKLDFVFLRNNKDRIYVVSREIEMLDLQSLNIDSVGLYFGTLQSDGFRVSIEGSQIIGYLCTKNILNISKEDKHKWMTGNNIELNGEDNRYVLVKSGTDFFGCGKIKNGELLNSVSKSRRLKVVNEKL